MASITSLMNNSSTSSIYGSRNVLSGLASGMDTETMIENAVSGIKLKIQNLVKKRTKVEWQQEAYRSIIDKAVNFNNKYTSYSSKTNLLSQSFFTNAVNTTASGTYADKVTASGKSSSDIKINAVKQMAKAASYTVSGLAGNSSGALSGIDGGEEFNIYGQIPVSTVSGSLTFQYGGTNGTTFSISFDELEDLSEVEVKDRWGNVKQNATNAEKLAQAINNKLADVNYTYTKNGFSETTTADQAVKATANSDGTISFSDGLGNGNKVTISSATGNMRSAFDLYGTDNSTIDVGDTRLTRKMETYNYLSDKELGVTFNGTTKKISMASVLSHPGAKNSNDAFVDALNEELGSAFGEGKVTASMKDGKLSFATSGKGDTLSLGGSAIETMGFENGDSNFINTGKKLKDLAGDVFSTDNLLKAVGSVRTGSNGKMVDAAGNTVKLLTDDNGKAIKDELGNNIYARVNSEGKMLYNFEVNGAKINVTEDTTLESLMNSINSSPDAGVKVSYSKLTNEFKFTATETGSNGKIQFGGMAKELFGDPSQAEAPKPDYSNSKLSDLLGKDYDFGTDGRDFTMQVNGESFSVKATKDSTIDSIVNDMNQFMSRLGDLGIENFKGVKASFDPETNSFVFKDEAGNAVDAAADGGIAGALVEKLNTPAYAETKLSDILGKDYDFGNGGSEFRMNVMGEDFTIRADGNSTIKDVLDSLNGMLSVVGDKADEKYKGVKASFDPETNSLVFKDKDGNAVEASAGGGLAEALTSQLASQAANKLPGGRFEAGQDAIMDVEINGVRFADLTRSSNSFDLDGLTVNVKGTFNEDGSNIDKDGNAIEPVTFTTTTDSDKIVDAIRSFVDDYNEMITEIKNAYSTQPLKDSKKNRYEPLTAEEESEYSESELKAYNEKAKTGILFGDSNLSSMYSRLLNAIQPGGTDGQILRDIGIGTSYADGLTTLSLDEDKLRDALDSDPDKVRSAFTKTVDSGSTSNGLMQTMQNTLNTYVKTTGEPKGVLITRAGSVKSPTSLNSNSLKSQMDNIDNQIERWQNKMADQIDRYTTQFTRLEQLIAEMNSQASAMSGLMGGSSGY